MIIRYMNSTSIIGRRPRRYSLSSITIKASSITTNDNNIKNNNNNNLHHLLLLRIRSTILRSVLPEYLLALVVVVITIIIIIVIPSTMLVRSSNTCFGCGNHHRYCSIRILQYQYAQYHHHRKQQQLPVRRPMYPFTPVQSFVITTTTLSVSNTFFTNIKRRNIMKFHWYTTTTSIHNNNHQNYGYYNNFNLNDGFSYSNSIRTLPTTVTAALTSSTAIQSTRTTSDSDSRDNNNNNNNNNYNNNNNESDTSSSSSSSSSTIPPLSYYDPYDDYDANAAALNLQYEQDSTNAYDDGDLYETSSQQQQFYTDDIYDDINDNDDDTNVNTESYYIDEESPILQNLNENQIDAVTKPMYSITRVIAGPGSGKTRVLTNRIGYLLLSSSTSTTSHSSSSLYPPQILAVTFTRKASNEMQERLHKLLINQEQYVTSKYAKSKSSQKALIDEEYLMDNSQGKVSSSSVDESLRRVTLGTFHSVCTKILRWNGEYLSSLPSVQSDLSQSDNNNNSNNNIYTNVLNSNFNIMDDREQTRILKETLQEYKIDLDAMKNIKIDHIMKEISSFKTALYGGKNPFEEDKVKSGPPSASTIAKKIYHRFREKVLFTNSLDFDDLLYLTRELLVIHKDIRVRYQKKWVHVFVDEYQDTSTVQVDLIKLLTTNSLFVVGDADQSIYAWRGAYAESLYDFDKVFQSYNPDGVQTVYLMENYRSTSKIVLAAQKVISQSKSETGANKLRREMIPRGQDGTPPRILSFSDGEKEAEYLVNKIHQQLASGEYGPDHTLAFIYRTNAQSRLMEEALVQYNIPYVIFGSSTSFYNRQEIKDCLCFLRWINNGRDRMAMLRAVETPKRGLGDSAIREFDDYCALVEQYWDQNFPNEVKPNALDVLFHLSGEYSWCTIPNPHFPPFDETLSSRPRKLWMEFSNKMVSLWKVARRRTVSETLQEVMNAFELKQHFDKISKTNDECTERLANVDELIKASLRYEKDGACLTTNQSTAMNGEEAILSPLGVFLDDILMITESAKNSVDGVGEDRFVASLMTIHASKGMEFDSVYFVGVEDGTIPSKQSIQLGEHSVPFEEEKRLCYVAMTRAKSELVMSWRQSVTIFTTDGLRNIERPRSRFLDVLVSSKATPKSSMLSSTPMRGYSDKRPVSVSVKDRASQIKYWSSKSPSSTKVRHIGTDSTPSAAKFTGTASVYASRKPQLSIARTVDGLSKNNTALTKTRPSTNKASPPKKMHDRTGAVFPKPDDSPGNALLSSSTNGLKASHSASKPSSNSIDSSWFFPIGSRVRHKRLGDGIVLPPSGDRSGGSMTVLVEFHSGKQQEFPVQTTDLSPVVL